jgi:hypothetical protein
MAATSDADWRRPAATCPRVASAPAVVGGRPLVASADCAGRPSARCGGLWRSDRPTSAAASELESAPAANWFNTINLRCSWVLNVTFPSFMIGQNR